MLKNEIKKTIVLSETPIKDIWEKLLLYSCDNQIKKYNKNIEFDEFKINIIKSSFMQAKEYFDLSEKASILVKPLLEYYCYANLLIGCSNLKFNDKININSHGMTLNKTIDFTTTLSDIKVNFIDKENGGINKFHRLFGNNNFEMIDLQSIKVADLFLSVIEINQEAIDCFGLKNTHCLKYSINKTQNGEVYHINSFDTIESTINILESIKEFNDNYVIMGTTQDKNKIIVRKKFLANEINMESIFGEPYFITPISKNMYLKNWELYFIILFALCSLCRYYPYIWNNIISNSYNNEKILIEKFLRFANRVLPNYLLNILLNTNNIFIDSRYEINDKNKYLNEEKIKDLVQKTIMEFNNAKIYR